MLEKHIQNQILAYLASQNIFCWNQKSMGTFDRKKQVYRTNMSRYRKLGVSDILGIFQGKFLAIEVKAKHGRISEHQTKFIQDVKDQGGIGFFARSVEEVEKELNAVSRV